MQELKTFNVRLPKDLWLFLKKESADQETSMCEIILTCLTKYRKNKEKKLLTGDNAMV